MNDGTDRRPLDPKDPRVKNRATFLRVGLLFAVAALIASMMKPVFFAATLSTMLFFAAIGAAFAAMFLRERPTERKHLTRWDEAAMLLLVSLLVGSFADPNAMQTALQQAQQQQQTAAAQSHASSKQAGKQSTQSANAGANTGGHAKSNS